MRLLVTRPEPEAGRTAAVLVARGHAALVDPLLTIVALPAAMPTDRFDALALTSANAARLATALGGLTAFSGPVFAVGRRTAEAAQVAGFVDVVPAEGGIDDLAAVIASRLTTGARVLWLAGQQRSGDLAGALAPLGIGVQAHIIYRAEAADRLAPATLAALARGRIDGILHYSRRTCETLLAAASRDDVYEAVVSLPHYALSAQVAVPLVAAGATVCVAATPDERGLLDLLPSGEESI